FTVASSTTPVLAVPSFARGPGQSVVLGLSTGIPISISNATDVTQVSFHLTYDPTLLSIDSSDALTLSPDAIAAGLELASYSISNTDAHHSVLSATLSGGTGLTTTSADELVAITASVPASAPYLNKAVLNMGSVYVNSLPAAGVSGVQLAAYIGDVLGTGL